MGMQNDDGIEDFKHYGGSLLNQDEIEEQSENEGNESGAPDDALLAQVEKLEARRDETYQWVEDMGSVGVAL